MHDTWRLGLATAILMAIPSISLADDWTAAKLFGEVQQFVDGQWQPVARGDLVPDGRLVRTVGYGHVSFTRGNETVDLGPKTQIQIFDEKRQKPFTTVKQYFGTVSVEAEVEQVQHFAVQTPYLAAVVKGTRFTVVSGETGASVTVRRGHVAVEDRHDHSHVLLSVGQSAAVDTVKTGGQIVVAGDGKLPQVLTAGGTPVVAAASAKTADKSNEGKSGASGPEKADKANGNGSGRAGGGNSDNEKSDSGNSVGGSSGSGPDDGGKGKSGDNKDDG